MEVISPFSGVTDTHDYVKNSKVIHILIGNRGKRRVHQDSDELVWEYLTPD